MRQESSIAIRVKRVWNPTLVALISVVGATGCSPQLPSGWELATRNPAFGRRYAPAVCRFDGKIWLIGGESARGSENGVWFTKDGKTWKMSSADPPFAKRSDALAVEFRGKLYVLGGQDDSWTTHYDVWSTSDGRNWDKVADYGGFPSGPSALFSLHVLKNRMILINGGRLDEAADVWASDDGAVWQVLDKEPAFGKRTKFASAVFQDRLWLIGGEIKNQPGFGWKTLSDIWVSDDGRNWKKVLDRGPFGKRKGHVALAFQDRLWVIAGTDDDRYSGDAWHSKDGKNWEQACSDCGFPPREKFSAVSFDKRIWVIGGWRYHDGGRATVFEDVWRSR